MRAEVGQWLGAPAAASGENEGSVRGRVGRCAWPSYRDDHFSAELRVPMYRPVTLSLWSIIAVICLCLGSCDSLNPVSPQTPLTLPELSMEEHALKSVPPMDESGTFVPVESTQEKILSKHQDERSKRFSDRPLPPKPTISLGGDQFIAATNETNSKVSVQVSRNDTPIYTVQVGDSSTTAALRGLWADDNHWILEVAHAARKFSFSNEIDFDVWGEIIQDGISLNRQHGYQEAFGFQLMKGKPFYFFKKRGQLGVSYNGVQIPLGYARVPHYGCCSASALNPRSAKNMAAFFAQRGGVWYYVEIGVFD